MGSIGKPQTRTRLREAPALNRHRVAMLAHDLRGSLSVILGVLSELEDDRLALGERDALAAIARQSGAEALRLVESFLGSDAERAAIQPIDPGELVHGVVGAMRHRFDGKAKAIDVRVDAEARGVLGDPTALRRLVENLVDNAVRHAASCVAVLVEATEEGTAIVVEDDGDGIPPRLRRTLFDPGITTRPNGTGLGLSIVRRIVEEHGGDVVVRNRVPRGARFEVTLPASDQLARAFPMVEGT